MRNLNQKKIEYHFNFLNKTHYDRRYLINSIGLHLSEIIKLLKKHRLPTKLKELENEINILPFTKVTSNYSPNHNFKNEEMALEICSEAVEIIEQIIFNDTNTDTQILYKLQKPDNHLIIRLFAVWTGFETFYF